MAFQHRQWIFSGLGDLFMIDGAYLLNYLKLTQKKKRVNYLLDDIMLIANAYVIERNEQLDKK